MASQIISIDDIASKGVVKDIPAVALKENIFTDVLNIRFQSNAVRKMLGEQAITTPFTESIIHVAFWDTPNLTAGTGYYIVVTNNGSSDTIYAIKNDGNQTIKTLKSSLTQGGVYQHTLFNGGFAFIINNGIDRPLYILDAPGNTNVASLNMYELPGWDSYHANEAVVSTIFNSNSMTLDFSLGQTITLNGNNFVNKEVLVTITDTTSNTVRNFAKFTAIGSNSLDASGTNQNTFTAAVDSDTNTIKITPSSAMIQDGDGIVINVRATNVVRVRCGVIRSYKNLLVAGNLTEYDPSNANAVVRRLAGVVRTSDVAAPGSIPSNWNPFNAGVNTADEFILSSTGTVQDMAELQGRLYIYTNTSIHSLEQTGSQSVPFSISTVTDSHGAQTIEAIQEYDGQHIVVGNRDVYIFGGHPGSIQSVAEDRVRSYLFENINKAQEQKLFILRYQNQNEIWIGYPKGSSTTVNEFLIWNYRDNLWTIRRMESTITSGDIAPFEQDPNDRVPIFSYGTEIMYADKTFSLADGSPYTSYVERRRLSLTPEFDTETLMSAALKAEGSSSVLTLQIAGSNLPAVDVSPTSGTSYTFTASSNYKVDIRENGRFLNYRLGETAVNDWNISGLQYEIKKGGIR